MIYYLDTSALAKIYHEEAGSAFMVALFKSNDAIEISDLGRVEFVATTVRKWRSGNISRDTCDAKLLLFDSNLETRFKVFGFTETVVSEAMNILAASPLDHYLRTLDALHIAFHRRYCAESTVFVCADFRLAAFAASLDIPVLNPLEA
ncbi:MAG: type II toxin-antitoxin system VapC family toxin [Candidatus Hydrogenedentes bacterium]|nr:type II toxin-antitoxin system VapC family toxin [Candidatus Hydrogenedentota bacterium]